MGVLLVCISVHHVCACALRHQKCVLEEGGLVRSPETEVTVVSHEVLGIEPGSARAASTLDYWIIFSAPAFNYVCWGMYIMAGACRNQSYQFPWSWSYSCCEPPEMSARNWTQVLCKREIVCTSLSPKPSLQTCYCSFHCLLCASVQIWMCCSVHREVTGQLIGVHFLLPCGSQESNSGPEAW